MLIVRLSRNVWWQLEYKFHTIEEKCKLVILIAGSPQKVRETILELKE